ncbi:hypothetical protein Hanom_Chr08g00722931 [Helianthus anomalus]
MISSPVISRPEPVIMREDEPAQLGKMGGDGKTTVDDGYGSSHANLDSLHEERESDGVGSGSKKLGGGSYPNKQQASQKKEGGGQQASNKPTPLVNNVLFFKSTGEVQRPKKYSAIIRPRNRKQSRPIIISPSSDQRPRKRTRADGVFTFDLNLRDPEDANKEDSGNVPHSVEPSPPGEMGRWRRRKLLEIQRKF